MVYCADPAVVYRLLGLSWNGRVGRCGRLRDVDERCEICHSSKEGCTSKSTLVDLADHPVESISANPLPARLQSRFRAISHGRWLCARSELDAVGMVRG